MFDANTLARIAERDNKKLARERKAREGKVNKRECLLETYDGTKEAYAYMVDDARACVQAKDGSYAIPITRGTLERKFEGSDKPTFYAC